MRLQKSVGSSHYYGENKCHVIRTYYASIHYKTRLNCNNKKWKECKISNKYHFVKDILPYKKNE